MLPVQLGYITVHVRGGQWQQGGWPTQTFCLDSEGGAAPERPELSCDALPSFPCLLSSLSCLFDSIAERTLWLICLKWLAARENSHVPSDSKKTGVVMEAMMMTCQRKAITQCGPYSHNSAQTVALAVCTSCTHISSHWFEPIRDKWQSITGYIRWINEQPTAR